MTHCANHTGQHRGAHRKTTRRLLDLTTLPAGELVNLNTEETHPLMPMTTLGRATSNVIAIADPTISLEHALIARRDGTWWLEDLQSRNGTHLNDHPIPTQAVVTSGNVISIGSQRFKVTIRPYTTEILK